MKIRIQCLSAALALFSAFSLPPSAAFAQGTAFAYQGRLNNGGSPAAGTFDFVFTLYDTNITGLAIAGPVTNNGVGVTNGLFTTLVDFGPGAFTGGATNWLEIGVATNGVLTFNTLAPRQELTPVPYAVYAESAGGLPGLLVVPDTNGAPSLIGGSSLNFIGADVLGAAIGGGGADDFLGSAYSNGVTGDFGVVGGGIGNTAGPGYYTVVGGGFGNTASGGTAAVLGGAENLADGSYAVVVGGFGNHADGAGTFVGGGGYDGTTYQSNFGIANASFIGGGLNNYINSGADYSVIGGGHGDIVDVSSYNSAIGGGDQNWIGAYTDHSYVGGGLANSMLISGGGTANVIGGGEYNGLGSSNSTYILDAVIAGGGNNQILGFPDLNADYLSGAVISGGDGNLAEGNDATVGGGNINSAISNYCTVGGGVGNLASGVSATVAGGGQLLIFPSVSGVKPAGYLPGLGAGNTASGDYSFVGGGRRNTASAIATVVAGGDGNTASLDDSVVSGGWGNMASDVDTVISGGDNNNAGAPAAVVAGGEHNMATGDHSVVSGGIGNTASGDHTAVVGGQGNSVGGSYGVVGGGQGNNSVGAGDVLAGGYNNSSSGGNNSTISGGNNNGSSGSDAVVGGGQNNQVSAFFTTIGGGVNNTATNDTASVSGGTNNAAGGFASTVAGGANNQALGDYSLAAGDNAEAAWSNSFVWSDGSTNTVSTTNNQFVARAVNGFVFYTSTSNLIAASLAPGETSWATLSDRNAKKDFAPVNTQAVLEKLAGVPVEQWHYKWESADSTPNLGPMAQDFIHAFYPGRDDKSITTLEFDGVELAAIQGLNQRVNDKDAEIQALKQQNEELEKRLDNLEEAVKSIANKN